MKLRWDNQHVRWGVTSFLVIAASMLFYYGVFHMKTLITGIQTFLGILTPIVYGVVIAFLLTPVLNFLEKKIIYPLLARKEVSVGKKGRKAIRWACVILCMFLFLALIYALIMMILPELIRSIMGLIYSFPAYVKVIQKWLQSFIEKWNLNSDALDTLNQSITTAQDYLTTNILPQMQEMLKNISAGVFELINFLKNFLIGAIVSLYLMADKEGFIAKAKMLTYAIFNTQHANFIIHSMRFTNRTFIGFFSGKILDSAIIGVLCYIGMNFLNMPYILLDLTSEQSQVFFSSYWWIRCRLFILQFLFLFSSSLTAIFLDRRFLVIPQDFPVFWSLSPSLLAVESLESQV